jgi:NAD(P)-dependent dehydrogenase (short-subunit alcohol dehydrogenase family)
MDGVSVVPLDVTDPTSVKKLAAEIGGKTDILINTARHVRPGGVLGGHGFCPRRMEVNALGLMRLAQAFGPGMASRTADGVNNAVAFVNILSVHALSPIRIWRVRGEPGSSALDQPDARAEFSASGLRMINVYRSDRRRMAQPLPPPKVAPKALAASIVEGSAKGSRMFIAAMSRRIWPSAGGATRRFWNAKWREAAHEQST